MPPARTAFLATELGRRLVSALVLAAVVLAATVWGGVPFALVWLAAASAVALEWLTITRCAPRVPLVAMAVAVLAVLTLATILGWPLLGAAILALGLLASLALAEDERSGRWAVAGLAYAAVIATVPTLLRDDPGIGIVGPLWLFGVVWGSDVAAYFTGRALGGPKLWPAVSPRKTWSGFLGGVAAGALAGAAIVGLAGSRGFAAPPIPAVLLASGLAAAAGQVGDLGESALKRAFEVKDSGRLIPGHGGFLDRLDAFWAVAALAGLARLAWAPGSW